MSCTSSSSSAGCNNRFTISTSRGPICWVKSSAFFPDESTRYTRHPPGNVPVVVDPRPSTIGQWSGNRISVWLGNTSINISYPICQSPHKIKSGPRTKAHTSDSSTMQSVDDLLAQVQQTLVAGSSPPPRTPATAPPPFWPWAVQLHEAGLNQDRTTVERLLREFPTTRPLPCLQEAHSTCKPDTLMNAYYQRVVGVMVQSWQNTTAMEAKIRARRKVEDESIAETVKAWMAYVDSICPPSSAGLKAPVTPSDTTPIETIYIEAHTNAEEALQNHTVFLLTTAREEGFEDTNGEEARLRGIRDTALARRQAARQRWMRSKVPHGGHPPISVREESNDDRAIVRRMLANKIHTEVIQLRAERSVNDAHVITLYKDGEIAKFDRLREPQMAAQHAAERKRTPPCCESMHEYDRRQSILKILKSVLKIQE